MYGGHRSTAGLGYYSPTPANGGGNACILDTSDTGTVESHRYYLARRTALEMLRDRGCVIAESEISRSLADFRSAFGDQPDHQRLTISAPLSSSPSKKILVTFGGPVEINKAQAQRILSQIENKGNLHRIILVLESKVNSFARKEFDECEVKVEIFPIGELLVNVTKHFTVPKHRILSAEEKQLLLEKHNLKENQIPFILETDAIARYYGFQKKQVVRVTHDNKQTGTVINYRCVI